MMRALTVGVFALFSLIVAGTALAQERQVLQEGYTGIGTGRIGSGAGQQDNQWMRDLLAKPETIFGRVMGIDIPGQKIHVQTGGDAIVTVRLSDKTNLEELKQIKWGDDVEIQAYRKTRVLGSGAFAAEIPEGEVYMLSATVLRPAMSPFNSTPQAGFDPDTDRAIKSRDSSVMGGVGGQCFQCYPADSGYTSDYPTEKASEKAPEKAPEKAQEKAPEKK